MAQAQKRKRQPGGGRKRQYAGRLTIRITTEQAAWITAQGRPAGDVVREAVALAMEPAKS